jgi:hypothetical protein
MKPLAFQLDSRKPLRNQDLELFFWPGLSGNTGQCSRFSPELTFTAESAMLLRLARCLLAIQAAPRLTGDPAFARDSVATTRYWSRAFCLYCARLQSFHQLESQMKKSDLTYLVALATAYQYLRNAEAPEEATAFVENVAHKLADEIAYVVRSFEIPNGAA